MRKRILASLLLIVLLFFLAACAGAPEYGHAELRLPLASSFRATSSEGFDASYTDGTTLVGIMRISFVAGYNQGIPDTLMPSEFAEYYKSMTEKKATVRFEGDVPYYIYNETIEDSLYTYLACFYRSKYAYFIVLFACRATESAALLDGFLGVAASATFVQ